jgi:hypothetical protein
VFSKQQASTNGNGFASAQISTQYGATSNGNRNSARAQAGPAQSYNAPVQQPATEFLETPLQQYGAPGVDTSIETSNSIYAQDGGYAEGRPAQPSNVPETIQQSYDSNGGYQY